MKNELFEPIELDNKFKNLEIPGFEYNDNLLITNGSVSYDKTDDDYYTDDWIEITPIYNNADYISVKYIHDAEEIRTCLFLKDSDISKNIIEFLPKEMIQD